MMIGEGRYMYGNMLLFAGEGQEEGGSSLRTRVVGQVHLS